MSAIFDEYFIRPAKPEEKTAIWQLLLDKPTTTSLWRSLGIFVICLTLVLLGIIYISFELIIFPAWDYFQVYGLKAKFILNLSLVSLLFFISPVYAIVYFVKLIYKTINPERCLVAFHKNEIVGYVALIKLNKQQRISRLMVKTKYRQQGIGTKLLQEIVKNNRQPIYIDSIFGQSSFYARLGFVKYKYQQSWRTWLSEKEFTEKLVLLPDAQMMESNKPSGDKKYTIQKASDRDLLEIYSLLENLWENTQDSFLSFGYKLVIPVALPFCLTLATYTIILIGVLPYIFGFRNVITAIFLALSVIIFIASLLLISKIVRAIILKKRSQFYVIKLEDKIIGYSRISRTKQYSILHHIYTISSYGTQPINQFIAYFARQETQPVYVACPRKLAKYYYPHGFMPINVRELPLKLQQGGKISVKFGGINLVLWS